MSVASLAIQISAPCARSRACKLGSPITLLPPPRPAIPAHVPDQILALPPYRTSSAECWPGDGQTLPAIMGQPSLTVRREPAVVYGEGALRCAWPYYGKTLLGFVHQATIELIRWE